MRDGALNHALGVAAARLLEQRLVREFKIKNPAAGAEVVINVPGGAIWEFLSLRTTFQASAAAANRIVALQLTDADNTIIQDYFLNLAIVANAAATVNFVAGGGYTLNASPALVGTSSIPTTLPPSFRVQTSTTAKDAADQYSATTLYVRTWSESDIVQEMALIAAQFGEAVLPETSG